MKLHVAALGVVVLGVTVAGAPQQDPVDVPPPPANSIIVNSPLVNVLFTVTDKKGKLIPSLKKSDFRVFENGILQDVTGFSSEPEPPLSIALLIDASSSIRDKLKLEQDAAADFFQYTLIRKKDRATVIMFDSDVDLKTKEFTDNPATLREALLKIQAGGGTSMFDAIYLATKGDDKWGGLAQEQGRRVIVVISDGADTTSQISLASALEAVQLNDVVVYAISTNSNFFLNAASPNKDGDKNLKKLAEETGGQVFLPEREKELLASFERIKQDLRGLYTIAYRPSNDKLDGAFRKIRIDVGANKDLKARHRLGYYAPKPVAPKVSEQKAPIVSN